MCRSALNSGETLLLRAGFVFKKKTVICITYCSRSDRKKAYHLEICCQGYGILTFQGQVVSHCETCGLLFNTIFLDIGVNLIGNYRR